MQTVTTIGFDIAKSDDYENDGFHYTTNAIVRMGVDMYAAWKTLACPT